MLARVLLAAVLAAPLSAQPTSARLGEPVGGVHVVAEGEPSRGGGLSPFRAVLIPVAATAGAVGIGYLLDQREGDHGAGAVVILSGLLVGPSVGNLVQGAWGDAAIGVGLRAGGAVLVLGAVAGAFWNESDAQVRALTGVAVVGGLVGFSGVVYDVATAGTNARARRVTVSPSGAGLALRIDV